jgi:carbon storage regulator
MLVVTRLLDQKIIIGENSEIVLTVVDIQGNKVRLGIEADKSVPIFREEVYEKMKEEEGA